MTKVLTNLAQKITKIPLSIYLSLTVGLALLVRLLSLAKASIWHDEGYTTMIINLPPSEIIQTTISDVHPPLYYLLLHYWQAVFGSSVVSLRGFSVACGVAIVVLMYFLLRRLFSENVARLGTLFVALGPFLVRYSQEARMYALATLIAVGATYVFVRALSSKHRSYIWWILYGILIALGLYTQYFLALLVPVHLIYAWFSLGGGKQGLAKLFRLPGLWLSGLVGLILFSPWIPSMFAQVTRVSDGFWIPPISWFDIPNTLSMFMVYDDTLTRWLGVTFTFGLVALAVYLAVKRPKQRSAIWLLISWLMLPMIIIALLSLKSPVFYDRYFSFSAPAFYALLAVIIVYSAPKIKQTWAKALIIPVIIATLAVGVGNVYGSASHRMGDVADVVNTEYQTGDEIVSAELYTFFDFSYYNQTGEPVQLLSEEEFGEFGEWGLVRATNTERVASLSDIEADRVWVIGKTGDDHDYFTVDVPDSWRLVVEASAGDSVVKLFETNQ